MLFRNRRLTRGKIGGGVITHFNGKRGEVILFNTLRAEKCAHSSPCQPCLVDTRCLNPLTENPLLMRINFHNFTMKSNMRIGQTTYTNIKTRKVVKSLLPRARADRTLHTGYNSSESPSSLSPLSSRPYRSHPVAEALQSTGNGPNPTHNSLGLALEPSPSASRTPKRNPKFTQKALER